MKFPKRKGRGSWYELSNGEKVQGKEAALQAEAALHGDGGAPVGDLPSLARQPEQAQRTARVELVQAACRIMWGLPTAEDGWFGADTERKVREIQQRAGIEVSGEVDGATWAALLAGPG